MSSTRHKVDLVTDLTNGLNTHKNQPPLKRPQVQPFPRNKRTHWLTWLNSCRSVRNIGRPPEFAIPPLSSNTQLPLLTFRSTDLRTKYDGNSSESETPRTLNTPIFSPIHNPNTSTSQIPSTDELENKPRRIHHELHDTLRKLEPRKKCSNINNADKKAIKELKERDLVSLPSNKGTEICVVQKDR